MCGIVGYVGDEECAGLLVDGLRKLEYRGYDSAGVAVLGDKGLSVVRAKGKLANLEKLLGVSMPKGATGIGHTRWATHGKPSDENAHPHKYGGVAVVHNGIIENHLELKEALISAGHKFSSETDTEIFAHLIQEEIEKGLRLPEAVRAALNNVRGTYALAVVSEKFPDMLVVSKNASPLVVGLAGCRLDGKLVQRLTKVQIVACGTSWHASITGKLMIETLAKIPVEVDLASEFRYRDPLIDSNTLCIAVSQSGETADTLGSFREAKARGARTLAICNVVGSAIAREAEDVLYTHAGPEIGVASTKAFTTQLAAFFLLAVRLGPRRGTRDP